MSTTPPDMTDYAQAPDMADQYRIITEISMDGFLVVDQHARIVEVNNACCTILGYSRDELLSMTLLDIEAVESPQENQAHIRKVMAAGHDRFETRHRHRDGTTIDVEVSTIFQRSTGRFLTFIRDITERKRATENQRALQQRLGFLLAASPAVIYTCRPSGDFGATFISDTVTTQLGYEPREFLEDPAFWMQHIHPDDTPRVLDGLQHLFEQGRHAHEYRFRAKDGTWRWMHDKIVLVHDAEGNPIECVGSWLDITNRKRAEEALRNSLQTSDDIVQAIPAGLYIYQHTPLDDLILLSGNPEAERLTGLRAEEWLGHEFNDIWPGARQTGISDRYLEVMHSGKPFETEDLFYLDNRLTGAFRVRAFALPGSRLAVAFENITERKQAEAALRTLNEELDRRVAERTALLQEAYREQESFSYSVSHDLRAPLRHINSYSAIIEEDFGEQLPAEVRQYLDRIGEASRRMGRLIDDLLELSRIGRTELHLDTINLSRQAARIVAILRETEPERTVECRIADGLTARGDRTLVRQLLQNLLGNAWKYTATQPHARIEFGRTVVDGREAFFVRDNGVGFDMTYADKLFGPFQRLHGSEFEGTGIGLAWVQRIVHRHGGRVWAEAKENGGATFYFTLPDS